MSRKWPRMRRALPSPTGGQCPTHSKSLCSVCRTNEYVRRGRNLRQDMRDLCTGVGRLGFQMSPGHSQSLGPWASYFASSDLGCVIHKVGRMMPVWPASHSSGEDYTTNVGQQGTRQPGAGCPSPARLCPTPSLPLAATPRWEHWWSPPQRWA